MRVKAIYRSDNPFEPRIEDLGYSKTIEVSDDIDIKWLEKMAKEDTKEGYYFEKLEKL